MGNNKFIVALFYTTLMLLIILVSFFTVHITPLFVYHNRLFIDRDLCGILLLNILV